MKVRLDNVRCSFLHVFEKQPPAAGMDGKAAFTGHFLLEPGSENHKKISKAILAVATESEGSAAKGKDLVARLKAKDQICLHDGNDKKDKYPEYEGMLYVSARSQVQPTVVDMIPKLPDGSPNYLTEKDGRPYSGCYVNASVDVYYSKKGKPWITAQLAGVQYAGKGDAFGGGRPADADEFDELEVPEAGNDPWADDDVPKAAGDDLV